MSKSKAFSKNALKSASVMAMIALVGLVAILSASFLVSDAVTNSYALDGTNVNSEVTAEIDGTHYVTLSASDVTFSITPTNGTASDKKQVDVELSTNVSGGASLYLSTSSNKNALYLNGDTNSTSQNIASASSTTTYDNMANNTWAYSTDDINYQGVPTLDSPVLLSDIDGTSTGTNTNGVVSATIPIYYAAKVDTSIPSGSYANSVTYLAVVDGGIVTSAELTSITVDGDTVEQLQLDKANTILVTTNLKTNTYGTPRVYYTTTSPSGYAECGNVVVASNAEGYMTIQCETTPTTVATGLSLHIVPKGSSEDTFCTDGTYEANSSQCEAGDWKWGSFTVELPDMLNTISTITYMQDMTPRICGASTENETKRLIDKRDGKYYWVAKLKDGNCWMTQNLDLDLSTDKFLTPSDTDITRNWRPAESTTTTILNEYSGSDSGYSYDPGDQYYEDTDDEHYHIGNYYQLKAANVGYSGTTEAPSSICPKGWTLPREPQFQALIDSGLTTSNFMDAPYYFVRGGYVYSTSLNYVGSRGCYWSATRSGASAVTYYLVFSSDGVSIDASLGRTGRSVRCVALSA